LLAADAVLHFSMRKNSYSPGWCLAWLRAQDDPDCRDSKEAHFGMRGLTGPGTKFNQMVRTDARDLYKNEPEYVGMFAKEPAPMPGRPEEAVRLG